MKANFLSLFILACNVGCVLIKLIKDELLNGFEINILDNAGFPNSIFFEDEWILTRASLKLLGSLVILEPTSSAKYSLEREIDKLINVAAIGARIDNTNTSPKFESLFEEKIAVHLASIAKYIKVPAIIEDIVVNNISLFFMCANS